MSVHYIMRFDEFGVAAMTASGAEVVAKEFVGKEVVIYEKHSIDVESAYFDKRKGIVLVSSLGEKHVHIPIIKVIEAEGQNKCKNCGAKLRMGVQMFPCSKCLVSTICHVCKAHCGKCKSKPMCSECIENHNGSCAAVSKKT
jgi:hypothetical protein